MSTAVIAIIVFVVLVLAGFALAMRASAKKKAAAAAAAAAPASTWAQSLGINALDQYSRVISSESLDQRIASL
jgi:flagellar basal body-associated protein FliL